MKTFNPVFFEACALVGTQAQMARVLKLSAGMVHQLVKGTRPVPTKHCASIERATKGRVPVQALRPDKAWLRVADANWPHPEGRPLLDDASSEP